MNEQMIAEVEKEECEHFDKEVCSRLNCKKDCKYYGKSNCYRCNHKEICQLRTFSYCEEEVKENGCEYYQQEIPENAMVLPINDWINFNKEHANELITAREEEYTLGYEQARKETAEKILTEIGESDTLVINTHEYGEIEVVPMERLKEIIKKKGVEKELQE